MFSFGLGNWFKMRFTRIIIIVPIIVLLALFARNQVSEFLSLAELLPDNSEITISDYFMGMLNMPQFFMFFAFPILFSILIADLITDDFEEGYALFLLSRMQNRTQYILHKIYILLIVSLFFVFLVITISVLIWLILKTPISGETYHYIFLRDEELSIPLIYTWMKVISFFFLGVFLHGLITLVITMYTNKPSLTIGLIIIAGFIHNVLYVTSQTIISFMPLSQYVVGMHKEYEPFGLPIDFFDLINSYVYMIIMCIILIVMLIRKFRSQNL